MAQIKTDWYQSETSVVVTVLVRNLQQDQLAIAFAEKALDVKIQLPEGDEQSLHFDLAHSVDPAASSYKIMSTKVEIKLKKVEGIQWSKLEGQPAQVEPKCYSVDTVAESPKVVAYPSSKGTDWGAIEKEIKQQEEQEKPEGEEALNSLFQKIYGEGNDEVKKAMNKSFFESGGTVLSTNWKEIAAKKTEVKPPDGVEFKKWTN